MALADLKERILHCDGVEGEVWVHAGKRGSGEGPACSAFQGFPSHPVSISRFPGWSALDCSLQTPRLDHSWSLRVGRGLCVSLDLWVLSEARGAEQGQPGQDAQPRGVGVALGPRGRCFRADAPFPT